MEQNTLKKKFVIIFLIIAILAPYVPVFTTEVEAVTPGYHMIYHNNYNWTNWGVLSELDNCNNYEFSAKSKICYHYLRNHVITIDLHHNGSYTVPTTDGGTWRIESEILYAFNVNDKIEFSTNKNYATNRVGKYPMDLRIYYFSSSCESCESEINGKYIKGLAFWHWLDNGGESGGYGPYIEYKSPQLGGTSYRTLDDPERFYYFVGYARQTAISH